MNLLLVDDEIAMLHIMEKAIDWKKKGIQKVFTAYNTDLARDIISSSKIDLVICDIEMPKENGTVMNFHTARYPTSRFLP